MATLDPQDESARCRAVEALAGRSDEGTLGVLLQAAREDSWRVRERAVRLLTQFPAQQLVECVVETVRGAREPSVRNAAMDALVRQGASVLPMINRLLTDESWELRLHGAVMLGNIRSVQSVKPLAGLLLDAQENVVHAAAESLGAIGDPAAVPFLVEVLRTQEFWSQYPTVVALGRIAHHSATEALLEFLNDDMLAPAVVDALGAIGDPRSLQPLLALLGASDDPLVPFNAVLKALVRIVTAAGGHVHFPDHLRASVSKAVTVTLASEEVDDRIAAIMVAGWSGDKELVRLVLPRLSSDAEQEVAYQALKTLGAPQEILHELLDAPQSTVRRSAIRLIGELGGSMDKILRHIIDHDETVRMEVALAVGRSERPDLSEYLLEMLLDESEEVRRVALEVLATFRTDETVREQLYRRLEYYPDDHLPMIIETLGRLAISDALPRLRALVGANHGEAVRAAVVRAVRDIGGEGAVELLLATLRDPAPMVRVEAIRAVSLHTSPEVFTAVAACVVDSDEHCAYAAVVTLGLLGNGEAVQILEKVAADAKTETGLRVEAVRSLGKLQANESAGALVDLLATPDPDVRREVTKALAKLKGREALEGLVRASMDSFWAVRATAIAALAQRGAEGLDFVVRALDDPDSLVRKAAVRGSAYAGPLVAMRIFPLLADDTLEEVVADTMEQLGGRLLPYLGDALDQPDPVLRLRLARVLGRIGGSEAKKMLEGLVADRVAEVAAVAAKSLAKLEGAP